MLLEHRLARMSLHSHACPAVAGRSFAGARLSSQPAAQVCTPCRSALVVDAKQKTRKAAAKRFKVQKDGTINIRHAGKQHMNEKKSKKRKKYLTGDSPMHETCINNNMGCIPYARIFIPQSKFSPGVQIKGPFKGRQAEPKSIPKATEEGETTVPEPMAKGGAAQQNPEHEPQLSG